MSYELWLLFWSCYWVTIRIEKCASTPVNGLRLVASPPRPFFLRCKWINRDNQAFWFHDAPRLSSTWFVVQLKKLITLGDLDSRLYTRPFWQPTRKQLQTKILSHTRSSKIGAKIYEPSTDFSFAFFIELADKTNVCESSLREGYKSRISDDISNQTIILTLHYA